MGPCPHGHNMATVIPGIIATVPMSRNEGKKIVLSYTFFKGLRNLSQKSTHAHTHTQRHTHKPWKKKWAYPP
jgi:hypothetical protein